MIPPPATTVITLEQRAFLRGSQKFEIRPDGEVAVTVRRFNSLNQFKFPLWHLDPSPARVKRIQLGNLFWGVVFGLGCLGAIAAMVVLHDGALIALLLLCALIFFLNFLSYVTTFINANVFHYRGTNNGIFIWFEKPDAKTYNEFCETLSKRAEEAWTLRPVEPSPQSLAGELVALKKLKDTGVLNDAEFERAKAKLLEQAEHRQIGFV